jgi:hypothetical protein
MTRNIFLILTLLLACVAAPSQANARQDSSSASFSAGGEVGLRITDVGLGNRARPGDWAAIQVDVLHRSSNPKPLAVIIRLDIPNDDGDRGMHQRVVVTNPNRPVSTWLYARLPFSMDSSSEIQVSAFLPFDQEAGSDTLTAYDPTKPVGMTTVRATGLISPNSGLFGIVGRRAAGVDRYGEQIQTTTDVPFTGHEMTVATSALAPATLPDRVHGLRAYEALVWTGTGTDEQPTKLNVAQADAIREWVAWGGHLVIVLPVVGQTWLDTPNPLSDILPMVHAVRREGMNLARLSPLLTAGFDPVPSSVILHTLEADPAAGPFDAMPILTLATGETVVARRQVGIGAVTVIGLDITNIDTAIGVRADAFWNRIFGKRIPLPTRQQALEAYNKGQIFASSRQERKWEQSIEARIDKQSSAALGLLVAVMVFGAFWLVAGPVGFFMLKRRSRVHHSWIAYVAAIGAFTAISWGAATVMRQRAPDASHITVLDHVYGQPCERARAWANIFLPSYGSTNVALEAKRFELAGRALEPNPAIAAWELPRGSSSASEFPETRRYVLDARDPRAIAFPSRATTRRVQFDWVGSPVWSMPLPTAASGETGVPMGRELALAVAQPTQLAGRYTVLGTLKHELPAELKDVVIIVNRGLNPVGRLLQQAQLTADAGAILLADPWKPGEVLDLSVATRHDGNQSVRLENYLDRITPRDASPMNTGFVNTQPGQQQQLQEARNAERINLIRLSLFSYLTPPTPSTQGDSRCIARRQSTHTLDLGRWLTQPCVIVMGFVEGDCPLPMTVDGREVPTRGLTMVRWVYPLPPSPPTYSEAPAKGADDAPAATPDGGG